jgi:hypothetical protein
MAASARADIKFGSSGRSLAESVLRSLIPNPTTTPHRAPVVFLCFWKPTLIRLRSHCDQYEASGAPRSALDVARATTHVRCGVLARSSACTLRCAGCITRCDLADYQQPFRRPTFDACRSRHKLPTLLRTSRF